MIWIIASLRLTICRIRPEKLPTPAPKTRWKARDHWILDIGHCPLLYGEKRMSSPFFNVQCPLSNEMSFQV
jgi:hypothetical protein